MDDLQNLVARLADRNTARSEATIQADVRSLLLAAPLHLDETDLREVPLESPVGDRRRIDIETGTTVIEVKRDLSRAGNLDDALSQLRGYVDAREKQTDRRYVGVLTDGAEWRCYQLSDSGLSQASAFSVKSDKPDIQGLLIWLEGVLATAQDVPPTPAEITARIGANSSSHALDRESLQGLYLRHKDHSSVRMKRKLWARLLTTALGSQFEDSDDLFVEHTLLVNTAEIIAHAVLGLDVRVLSPASLLTGSKFAEHGIHGVVEPDFFDWAVELPRGDKFVRSLARRLARFDWSAVQHDVLKVLYESVLGTETRKKLGEYYTPDWLAEAMVEELVPDPLNQRVLDPACGSGTFIFHAVRHFMAASEKTGWSLSKALEGVSRQVLGMDLHPVAVTLARVTYVLALGPDRLSHPSRGPIHVPVYLGDAMQWQKSDLDLWTGGYLVVQTEEDFNLFELQLRFPETLLDDAGRFDQLVEALATKASQRKQGDLIPPISTLLQRFAVPGELHDIVQATFNAMCQLHDEGRNHIWGYYVRNLARPVWLSQEKNRVDTLIGNPPWLAYRHMPGELQVKFREMSQSRGLWQGAKVATHQDLSGLFVTRVVQLYLHRGGRFGFIVPNAALDRAQFSGFRKGYYPDRREPVRIAFDTPWDLRRIRPHFFPRGSAVVFGTRSEERSHSLPSRTLVWTGTVDRNESDWSLASTSLARQLRDLQPVEGDVESPYRARFRQGASMVPRVLFLVKEVSAGPLGLPSGSVAVRSLRSAYEKKPWRGLSALEGVVESEFVFPVFLSENVLPYRTLKPSKAVIPWEGGRLLEEAAAGLELYPGLASWWRRASRLWEENRSSNRLSLSEQVNYHGKLEAQVPFQSRRVVYTKSGMHLCASRVLHSRSFVDHTLYWAAAATDEEALYLCAILNSAQITQLVRPLMSYGKDERHIDKHVWRLSIPTFDPVNDLHLALAASAARLEKEIQAYNLDDGGLKFVALRRRIRRLISLSSAGQEIEALVVELLN